jgi:hypothetical protein
MEYDVVELDDNTPYYKFDFHQNQLCQHYFGVENKIHQLPFNGPTKRIDVYLSNDLTDDLYMIFDDKHKFSNFTKISKNHYSFNFDEYVNCSKIGKISLHTGSNQQEVMVSTKCKNALFIGQDSKFLIAWSN